MENAKPFRVLRSRATETHKRCTMKSSPRLNRSYSTLITIALPFVPISKRHLLPKSNMNLLSRFTLALLVCSWRCAPAASAPVTK